MVILGAHKVFGKLADAILEDGAKKATKYLSPKDVVKAARRTFRRARRDPYANVEIVFTVGRPNYAERKFIKQALAAGEPFPIQKIQLKFPK